ncbi:MAG: hypothetical protein IPJ18_21040 [Betaproteobacteria bacterium]|nr:hypothetical protein [Betaproteobacteria bacterium]
MSHSDFLPTVTDLHTAPEVRIAAWREELLGQILKGTLMVGSVACLIGVYIAVKAEIWHMAVLNVLIIVALCAQVLLKDRLPFNLRVTFFCCSV